MSKILTSRVVSAKCPKTVVVSVERYKKHPLYEKKYKVSKKYIVDDPKNLYKVGDLLTIAPTKPLSKHKCWRVVKKIG
ncbi:MAG: 30S ribosomal protein S17 [Patescibacteria group bacterium]|nr:30S ribosomal protein S17 [Patescibacteria group bacterium]